MNIRLLEEKEITEIYEKKMPRDFAPGEIKPLSRILELCKLGKYFCYGIYEEEQLVGYGFLVTSEQRDAVLLDYFAVSETMRGKGYGGKCFLMLCDKVREQELGTLILEVENPRFGADRADVDIRRRRIAFYIRNGMTLTHLRIFLYDVEYLVMTSDSTKIFQAAEQIYGVYRVLLKPDKIDTKLKISSNIRCVATDLDRTLLQSGGTLSAGAKAVIKDLSRLDVEVVIASGRAYHTLPDEIKEMPELKYAITSNGAVISYRGKCIRRNVIPSECAGKILAMYTKTKERDMVAMEVFVDGKAYCEKQYYEHPELFGSGAVKEYVRKTRKAVENIVDFVQGHIDVLDSVDLISADDKVREGLRRQLSDIEPISVTSSMEHLIEIAAKDASKGMALQWLSQELGIESEECIAFGDADNDISMLAYAGVGVAVENASKSAKEATDYITKSADEDGVAVVCEAIVKIME